MFFYLQFLRRDYNFFFSLYMCKFMCEISFLSLTTILCVIRSFIRRSFPSVFAFSSVEISWNLRFLIDNSMNDALYSGKM